MYNALKYIVEGIFWLVIISGFFVLYIFARHDIIGLFVALAALLLAKKKRKYWSILILALAVALRFFPIMILPLLIIYLVDKKRDYIILIAIDQETHDIVKSG